MHVICGYESKEGILGNSISQFATFHLPRGKSPYLPLYDDIIRFATIGDIILLGDYNARTKDEQTTMFDTNEAIYGEVMAKEVGLKRQVQDISLGKGTWICDI